MNTLRFAVAAMSLASASSLRRHWCRPGNCQPATPDAGYYTHAPWGLRPDRCTGQLRAGCKPAATSGQLLRRIGTSRDAGPRRPHCCRSRPV